MTLGQQSEYLEFPPRQTGKRIDAGSRHGQGRVEILPAAGDIAYRLHQNLGHPKNADLVRVLLETDNMLPPEAVVGAKALRCAVCLRNQKVSRPRPSRLPRIGAFNDAIGIDILYIKDVADTTYIMLSILDLHVLFHVVARLENRTPVHVF